MTALSSLGWVGYIIWVLLWTAPMWIVIGTIRQVRRNKRYVKALREQDLLGPYSNGEEK